MKGLEKARGNHQLGSVDALAGGGHHPLEAAGGLVQQEGADAPPEHIEGALDCGDAAEGLRQLAGPVEGVQERTHAGSEPGHMMGGDFVKKQLNKW